MKRNLNTAVAVAVLVGSATTQVFAQPYDSRMRAPAQRSNVPAGVSSYDVVDCIAGFVREDGNGSYVCRSEPVRGGRGYRLTQVQSQGSGGPGFNPQDTPAATYANGRFQYECRAIPGAPR